jgi:hypothetical protein
MTSKSASDEVHEKALDKGTAQETVELPALADKDGEISKEESLPGWTIMRPLKRKGNKSSAAATKADVSVNGNGPKDTESKASGDLKATESNGSGDTIGEVEVLQDLRSDDELLGDEGEGQGRATRESGNQGNHTLNQNDGAAEETTSAVVEYKVYKRRWFGLIQLVLLNIIVSWDVSFQLLSTTTTCVREHILMMLFSGFLSLRVRLRYPNTMLSLSPPSIGSVLVSFSPSLSSRLW